MFNNKSKKTIAILCSAVVICAVVAASLIVVFRHIGEGQAYTVSFYSDDGTVLKIDTVKKHQSAVPPVQPEMSYGNIFVKWDKELSNVTSDMDVRPITKSIRGETNAFALSGVYGQNGSEVFIPLQLCGDVFLSGFELKIQYDAQLIELLSVFNVDGGIVYNDAESGVINLNYVSVENTTADVDICTFKFKIKANNGEIPIRSNVVNAYANDGDGIKKVDSVTIDTSVFVY